MKISVLSRKTFCKLFENAVENELENYYFISINNMEEATPIPEKYLPKSLVLNFDDTIEDYVYGVFTKEQARKIKAFADKVIANKKDLIIHCAAGISRSGATGVALNDYANRLLSNNKEDWRYFINKGCEHEIFPNSYVLRLLKKELGMSYE